MPDVATEPVSANPDPGSANAELSLDGFAEAFASMPTQGFPVPGQAEEPKAVEKDTAQEQPEAQTEKSTDAKATKDPEPAKDETAAVDPRDFEAFSDKNKPTWEQLLKSKAITPAQFKDLREDAIRQSIFSKKTAALARDKEAFEKSMVERKEDLVLLDKIRGDDRLHAAWLKASRGELPDDDLDPDAPVTKKDAVKIAEDAAERRLRGEKAEKKQTTDAEAERQKVYGEVIGEQQKVFGITAEQMRGYLKEIEATLDDGEPYSARELRKDLVTLHREKVKDAKIAELDQKVNQRAAAAERTAKQSQPPARRVVTSGESDPMRDAEESLGVDPDWGNVQGFGFRR